MKIFKKVTLILFMFALFTVISVFSTNAASCKLKAKVNDTNVNIRSGAGTNYSVVKILKKKANVTLLNTEFYNKDWYKIKLSGGKKGYIYKPYLTINENQVFIPKEKTVYLGYSGNYQYVNTTGKTLKFKSSDKTIAKVKKSGKVKSFRTGKVTITAKANNVQCVSTLNVLPATVTLGENLTQCFTDDTFQVNSTCAKPVTYAVSNNEIATIDSKGVVTPLKEGSVKITVSSKSDEKSFDVTFKKRVITLSVPKTTLFSGCHTVITPSGGKYDYTFTSSNKKVLTVDNYGLVTAVGEGTAKVTCKSGDLTKSVKFTVKNGSGVNISNTKCTVNQGMTLYLKSTTSGVTWTSSNTNIATVDKGFVLGVNKGTVIITASTSSGAVDCIVTVTDPQNVRFIYTSENSAVLGEQVTFYAITDTLRTDAKFVITDPEGKVSTITKTSKTTEDGRYIWSGSKKLKTAGVYTVEAYTKTSSSSWETCSSGKCTTFVNNTSDRKQTEFGERRVTTDLINMIAGHEGFVGTVYADKLAGGIPTVGYGRVVYAGATFYNGMTQKEAFAFLVKTVNESGYTSRINALLTDNKIKFNQHHFDALVDFSYNLGAYAISNNDDLLNVLLNSYGNENYKNKGYVNETTAIVKKKADSSSATLKTLSAGDTVLLVNTKVHNSNWYKIQLDEETVGFIEVDKVTRHTTNTEVRNLNNVTLKDFASNYLDYHHASKVCYKGLLYRRIDEVETFFYGDYLRNGKDNKFGLSYSCSSNPSFKI